MRKLVLRHILLNIFAPHGQSLHVKLGHRSLHNAQTLVPLVRLQMNADAHIPFNFGKLGDKPVGKLRRILANPKRAMIENRIRIRNLKKPLIARINRKRTAVIFRNAPAGRENLLVKTAVPAEPQKPGQQVKPLLSVQTLRLAAVQSIKLRNRIQTNPVKSKPGTLRIRLRNRDGHILVRARIAGNPGQFIPLKLVLSLAQIVKTVPGRI